MVMMVLTMVVTTLWSRILARNKIQSHYDNHCFGLIIEILRTKSSPSPLHPASIASSFFGLSHFLQKGWTGGWNMGWPKCWNTPLRSFQPLSLRLKLCVVQTVSGNWQTNKGKKNNRGAKSTSVLKEVFADRCANPRVKLSPKWRQQIAGRPGHVQ